MPMLTLSSGDCIFWQFSREFIYIKKLGPRFARKKSVDTARALTLCFYNTLKFFNKKPDNKKLDPRFFQK